MYKLLGTLLGVALILGLVSAIVEPVVKFLSLPFIIVTIGLFLLVINALMLMLTGWIAGKADLGFHVDSFWAAFLGGLVITLVTGFMDLIVDDEEPLRTAVAERLATSPGVSKPALRQARRDTTRVPMRRMTAGATVAATSTDTATVAAATRPISARIGMPESTRAASAMTTVAPANVTAEPAVATERATDSPSGIPWRMFARCRLTMKRA